MSDIIMGGWNKVDPSKTMHLGHLYDKEGKKAHDKRCDYCGKWMTYDVKNIHLWADNVKLGLHQWPEKVHCGSEHCQEYHRRVLAHEEKVKRQAAAAVDRLFFGLMKKGLIA